MSYLQIVIVLGLIGTACWVTFYLYFKKNPEKFRGLNSVLAIAVLGPFLPLIQSSLAKRNYQLTSREMWGIIAVVALLVGAVIASVVFGVGVRGR